MTNERADLSAAGAPSGLDPLATTFADVRERITAAIIDTIFLVLLLVVNLIIVSEFAGESGLIATTFFSVIGVPAAMTALLGLSLIHI